MTVSQPPALYADQDAATILARMVASANENIDPADEASWVDTREGGHWRTTLMPAVNEIARLYDLMGSEVLMCAFVLWADGAYLDGLAAQWDVVRNLATLAQGVERFTGTEGTEIAVGTVVGVEPSTPDDPAPEFEVTTAGTIPAGGHVDLPVLAREEGAAGNVAAGAITAEVTPLSGVSAITNPDATYGGRDLESDESLRDKTLEAVKGKGPGAVRDYLRWVRDWPGVGAVKALPVWNGAGTVLVMVTDKDGGALPSALLDELLADLDPVAGKGSGTAPIGATVTVDTSAALVINIAVTLEFDSGYSWAGASAQVALDTPIKAALKAYLMGVPPDGEVVYAHVLGIFSTWPGIHDVSGLTLNGGSVNIAVDSGPPPQIAMLGTVTVT